LYDGESLPFLYTDGDYGYCQCGGRLVEDFEPEAERRYRLVLTGHLIGTSLHRQLEGLLSEGKGIEVAHGRWEDHHIKLLRRLD